MVTKSTALRIRILVERDSIGLNGSLVTASRLKDKSHRGVLEILKGVNLPAAFMSLLIKRWSSLR